MYHGIYMAGLIQCNLNNYSTMILYMVGFLRLFKKCHSIKCLGTYVVLVSCKINIPWYFDIHHTMPTQKLFQKTMEYILYYVQNTLYNIYHIYIPWNNYFIYHKKLPCKKKKKVNHDTVFKNYHGTCIVAYNVTKYKVI